MGPPVCVDGQAPRQLRGLLIQPAIISSEKKTLAIASQSLLGTSYWSRVAEFPASAVQRCVGQDTTETTLDTPRAGHHMVQSYPRGPANIHVPEAHVTAPAPGLCPGVPCMISSRPKGLPRVGSRFPLEQRQALISPLPMGFGVLAREVLARGAPTPGKEVGEATSTDLTILPLQRTMFWKICMWRCLLVHWPVSLLKLRGAWEELGRARSPPLTPHSQLFLMLSGSGT